MARTIKQVIETWTLPNGGLGAMVLDTEDRLWRLVRVVGPGCEFQWMPYAFQFPPLPQGEVQR